MLTAISSVNYWSWEYRPVLQLMTLHRFSLFPYGRKKKALWMIVLPWGCLCESHFFSLVHLVKMFLWGHNQQSFAEILALTDPTSGVHSTFDLPASAGLFAKANVVLKWIFLPSQTRLLFNISLHPLRLRSVQALLRSEYSWSVQSTVGIG